MAAARALFSEHGYEAVSVDLLVQRAGVAKGAFYHHFASKRDLLERLIDTVQGELAMQIATKASGGPVTSNSIALSVGAYLQAAIEPDRKRILLVDGPAVLGWQRWREIDDRYFAAATRAGIGKLMNAPAESEEADAVTRLALGAIMEAALACGTSADAAASARDFTSAFQRMLSGVERER
ncbi:AcrR family transcriptional regulator [Sphingomonas sp. UYAg733]